MEKNHSYIVVRQSREKPGRFYLMDYGINKNFEEWFNKYNEKMPGDCDPVIQSGISESKAVELCEERARIIQNESIGKYRNAT